MKTTSVPTDDGVGYCIHKEERGHSRATQRFLSILFLFTVPLCICAEEIYEYFKKK